MPFPIEVEVERLIALPLPPLISLTPPYAEERLARVPHHYHFGKLILAASAYFIWMEQNNRTFKNTRRTPKEICDLIMVTVKAHFFSVQEYYCGEAAARAMEDA
ncbi:hypothetical protein Tco_0463339 [Tanacetum coccineum]